TEGHFESEVAEATNGLPITTRLSIDPPTIAGFEYYRDAVEPHSGAFVAVTEVDDTALQRLMYTSGTTARPKGVCITHSNFAWKSLGLLLQFGWHHRDVSVVGGPLYHVGALDMGGLTTLHAGGTLVVQKKFDAEDLLAL